MQRALLVAMVVTMSSIAAAQAVPDPFARVPVIVGPVPGEPGLIVTQTASVDVCGGVRVTVRDGKGKPGDRATRALLTRAFPAQLNFDPAHPDRARASIRRFERFVEQVRKDASAIIAQVNTASLDPDARAAAFARAVQVRRRMIELLLRAEIPVDVRTGAFAAEKTSTYCAKFAEIITPMLGPLDEGVAACHAVAEHAGAGWWADVC